jgi:choline dehydrogenase-like flavoprotein
MISDLEDWEDGAAITTDICIVGAGVAGLTLAREFLGRATRILIIESGGLKDESRTQRLYESEIVGMPHEGVHNGRFRVFGGSSTRWGAQLMTFESQDFSARDYIGYEAWPISCRTIRKYYRRAEEVLAVNSLPYEEELWSDLNVRPINFDHDKLKYRFSKWAAFKNRNLAKSIGKDFQESHNVTILLHANLMEVVPDSNGASVSHLKVKSLSGKKVRVIGARYAICSGAIETGRLLLASNSVIAAGVGNDHDLVGRYFQDHISVRAARLIPNDRAGFTSTFDPFMRGATMHSCKVVMTKELQRENRCLNIMGHVVYGFTEESGLYELRKILRAVQSKRNPIPSPMSAWRILRYSSDIFRMVFGQFLARRRLSPKFAKCHLDIECEQAPSRDSRVMLSEDKDELGMPKTVLDWRITDLEKHTIKQYVKLFRSEWERLDLGHAKWDESIFEPGDAWLNICRDTYHHAGTTRMSTSPSHGVVDDDLKVHGLDNLYIGSTSVFPTSSCANPTLTMMALCVRLADHWKAQGVK